MGHRIDRGDVIDMLEESITTNQPVVVVMQDGRIFEDRVKEIGKFEGEDHVAFAEHEFTPLRQISSCRRARTPEVFHGVKG